MDVGLPSGVVTFVLTDIVGSTKLWEQAPDEMGAALRVHDGIISRAVVENGGHVIKSRGEGDSTFSVFARASDAVRAAHAAQLGLAGATWPTPTAIGVRFAIHTGEATLADGDYTGSTVNRAARIRSVADGGEVLVSSATVGLVADQLPVDVSLVALGEVRLRDLRRPEAIHALAGPGLPALRTRARGESGAAVLAERGVTPREADMLHALADRLTNGEIAGRLSVGERTVETHVSSLLRKLGVSGRGELATIAKEMAAVAASPALPAVIEMLARRSSCVGRGTERARLLACWERAAGGAVVVAVVTGEAGMGKSRLVAELAVDVDVRGGRVLFGSCSDGSQVPYQPFVEALAEVVATTPEIQLRDDVGPKSVALARALPDLADRLGLSMPREVVDPEAERHATHDALHSFLSNVAQSHPTLLVVEDLHWASPTTRDAIRRIARTSGHSALLVVVTTRDTVPDVDAHLARWLADVARLPAAEVVAVPGLDVAAAQAVIAEVGGTLDASVAVRDTGGNPLFLREMATGRQSSRTLQGFLADRYSLVPEPDLDVLDVAVILGQTIHAEVAAAAERSVPDVIDVLERAEAAGLVQPLAGSAGFSFVHALFRSVRYDSIPTSRSLRLHAAAARALTPRADDPRVLPELAFHACTAAPLGGAADAVALARRAAEQATKAGDAATAVAQYRAALVAIDHLRPPDQRLRLELSIRLGTELTHIDSARGREVLADAAEQARQLGEPVAFADAVCSMAILGGSVSPGSDDPTFIAYAEDALALLGSDDEGWHIRVLATLGTHLGLGSQPARGREMVRDALERARQLGDQYVLARTLMSAPYVVAAPSFDEHVAACRELVELGHAIGSPAVARNACHWLRSAYRRVGDFTQMRHWAEVARRTGAPPTLNDLWYDAEEPILEGDLELGEQRLPAVADAAKFIGGRAIYVGGLRLQLAFMRGEDPLEWLRAAFPESTMAGRVTQAALALALTHRGKLDEAAAVLDEVSAPGFSALPTTATSRLVLAIWAEVAASLANRAAAAQLLELLDPLSGQLADGGFVWSSIDHSRALLMLSLGDAAGAVVAAEAAVAASRRRGTRLFLGRELVILAAARRAVGADEVEERLLVDEAVVIADATGAKIIRQDAARLGLLPS